MFASALIVVDRRKFANDEEPKAYRARRAVKLVPLTRGGFRWKLVRSNGTVVCVSADKFAKRSNAYRATAKARVVAKAATASFSSRTRAEIPMPNRALCDHLLNVEPSRACEPSVS